MRTERMWEAGGRRSASLAAVAFAAALLAGCIGRTGGLGETTQHGYVVSQTALQQVPVGSSRDQVLIALGSPSTTGEFGGQVFYYISQTRRKPAAFMLSRVVEQHVVAVYFDNKDRVTKLADYGLQDGKVFDFITRTTPTSGRDITFVQQVLGAKPNASSIFGGGR